MYHVDFKKLPMLCHLFFSSCGKGPCHMSILRNGHLEFRGQKPHSISYKEDLILLSPSEINKNFVNYHSVYNKESNGTKFLQCEKWQVEQ